MPLLTTKLKNWTRSRIARSHKHRDRNSRSPRIEPLEERQMLSITVTSLALVRDTAPDQNDGTTSDARLQGQLVGDANLAGVTIEFDHDNDSVADGTAESGSLGEFEYTPDGLGYGPVTIRARALEWDGQQYVPSDWQTIGFTFANEAPQVTGLQLVADTGIQGDLVTYDGRVAAAIADDQSASGYTIHFDYDGDGVDDDSLSGVTNTFAHYVGDGTGFGSVTIHVRASEFDVITQSDQYGSWASLSFTLQEAPVTPPQVTSLALANDVGTPDDGITSDPTVHGTAEVEGGAAGNYRIEFDLNADGIADQTNQSAWDGTFSYKLQDLAEGVVVVRARAGKWDADLAAFAFGDWAELSFTYNLDANVPPVVATLVLANDTDNPEDLITTDPSLSGTVTNDNNVDGIRVEIDLNDDGTADASAVTDADGNISYVPTDLDFGQRTVRARATEWDFVLGQYLNGPWKSLTFTLQVDPSLLPVVSELALHNDTGESNSDNVTEDPTLKGKIATALGVGAVDVEFDHDGDGVPDGTAVTDAEGNFLYEPLALPYGAATIQVRGKSWNNAHLDYVMGDWSSITFTLVPPPNDAPVIDQLTLYEDTGEEDGTTSNPTLTGFVSNDGELGGLTVEFDHDGDGVPDGTAATSASGEFLYILSGLPIGTAVTVQARAVESDATSQATLYGEWVSLAFTYVPSSDSLIVVSQLGLLVDTGDNDVDLITSNSTLVGLLVDDNSVGYLTVEFDHDGDGVVDGTTKSTADGHFTYLPVGLAAGTVTIRARAQEWDYDGQSLRYGNWTSFTFDYEPVASVAPSIVEFGLLSDSGASSIDLVTANPSVSGLAANAGPVSSLLVQIDYDGDDIPDGTTTTTSDGHFLFEPVGLAFGNISLRARALEWIESDGQYLAGNWTTLSFTYQMQPNEAPLVIELGLQNDTGDPEDLNTSDATIAGRISNEGTLSGIAIELDYDGDGVVDGASTTDRWGRFFHKPTGLPTGTISIAARARETRGVGQDDLIGQWFALTFNYDAGAAFSPVVENLALLQDTGSSDSDQKTTVSVITGTVGTTGSPAYLTVEFDHDGDHAAEGATATDGQGSFVYAPAGLARA